AVECLLKTKLMRRYHCDNLSELNDRMHQKRRLADESSLFTHELLRLLDLLQCRYRMQRNADSWRSFNAVNRWLPSWRYSANRGTEKDAIQFMDNVEIVLKWLMANT